MNDFSYRCKHCETTKIEFFYKGSFRACKICKVPANRRAGITSITKDPANIVDIKCIKCLKVLPKKDFDISATTGFHYDRCISCRAHNNNEQKSAESITSEPIVMDENHTNYWISFRKQVKDTYSDEYLKRVISILSGIVP